MSYHKLYIPLWVVMFSLVLVSCGGKESDVLVRGDDIQVTEDDFHREFERLLPDDQVGVLEPGGKLALVTRLAYREILLAESGRMELPDLDGWMEISEDVWMAKQWLAEELQRIYEAGLDSSAIDSMMSIEVSVAAVLLSDSALAMDLRDQWRTGSPFQPDSGMALAPWNHQGSSFFQFDGSYFLLHSGNPGFASEVIRLAGQGPGVIPAFGAWALVSVDTSEAVLSDYSIPAAARYFISSSLSETRDITVISPAVSQLAEHFTLSDDGYDFVDTEDLEMDMVLARYPGGNLTAGDVLGTAELVRDRNFFTGVPQDFMSCRLPDPMLDPEVDLWVYVEGLAEIRRQTDLAAEEGIVWPEYERQLTLTDQVLRERVLGRIAPVDTAAALDYYYQHSDLYEVPELRSIEVAFVPFDWMPEGQVDSFDDLDRFYSHTDESGGLIPTDPCPVQLYGGYGQEVFSAPESVFTGPVEYPGDQVFVFFRVVRIIPAGQEDPMLIMPVLMEDCRMTMVNSRLEDYLLELWDGYSVEIDSGLVRELDPWESGY